MIKSERKSGARHVECALDTRDTYRIFVGMVKDRDCIEY